MEDIKTPKDPLVPQAEATSPAVNNSDISFLLSEIRLLSARLDEMTHTVAGLTKQLEEKNIRIKEFDLSPVESKPATGGRFKTSQCDG